MNSLRSAEKAAGMKNQIVFEWISKRTGEYNGIMK